MTLSQASILAVAIIASIGLAGCGGGDPPASPSPAEGSAQKPTNDGKPTPSAGAATQCPYGAGLGDGCPEAVASGGTFQVSAVYGTDFYTYATQTVGNGQQWISSHPQPFNVAGVDYPIGYASTLTLKDPMPAAAAAAEADPGFSYPVTTPPVGYPMANALVGYSGGCKYYVGGSYGGYGDSVSCTAYTPNGPGASASATYDLEGFDFSLHGCIPVSFTGVVGNVIVKNNKWINGFGCNNAVSKDSGYFVKIDRGAAYTIENNYFDGQARPTDTGCGPTQPGVGTGYPCQAQGLIPVTLSGGTGPRIIKFNVFLWSSGRPIGATNFAAIGSAATEDVSNNYVEGMTCAPPSPVGFPGSSVAQHGELIAESGPSTEVIASFKQDYNTVITPSTCNSVNDITAPFWMGGPPSGIATPNSAPHVIYAEVNNNTTVNNLATNGGRIVGTAIAVDNYNQVDTFVSHGNYTDMTGAAQCYDLSTGNTVGSIDFGVAGASADYSLKTGTVVGGFTDASGYSITAGQPGCA